MTGQLYITRFVFLLVVFDLAPMAEAQIARDSRFMIGGDVGIQTTVNRRADKVNFDFFAETGRLTAVQDLGPGAVFNVSLSPRLWGRFGIGTTVSYVQTTSTATLDAQAPHPFFFEFPRSVTGSAGGLTHRELAIHVQGQYRIASRGPAVVAALPRTNTLRDQARAGGRAHDG